MREFEITDMVNQILTTKILKEYAENLTHEELIKIRKDNIKVRLRQKFLEQAAQWGRLNNVPVVYNKDQIHEKTNKKIRKVVSEVRSLKGMKGKNKKKQTEMLPTINEDHESSEASDRILKTKDIDNMKNYYAVSEE